MDEDAGASLIVDGELVLYGTVGDDFWGEGFTARQVLDALSGRQGDIVVRLNSGGGLAFDGIAIHNALRAYAGRVTVKVDAIAASAASIIAMAGDEIVMPAGALMMIHDSAALTIGTADAHDKAAAVLRQIDEAAVGIYAARTGLSRDEIAAMMDAETWLTGEQAVARGFATSAGDPVPAAEAAFDYDLYRNAPARLPRPDADTARAARRRMAAAFEAHFSASRPGTAPAFATRESMMDNETETGAVAATLSGTTAPAAAPQPAADAAAIRQAAVREERERAAGIRRAVQAARLPATVADELIEQGVTLDAARARVLDALADQDAEGPLPTARARITADGTDRMRTGMELALAARSGLPGGERNEYSGMTLVEMARETLHQRGTLRRGDDRRTMVGQAFLPVMSGAYITTSDFASILANTANKSMLMGYEEQEETWSIWTAIGTLSDYKPASRVGLNAFSALDVVIEHGEYTRGKLGERSATIQLVKYGKTFAISREAILNDDLSAFTRIPRLMGRAAQRKVGDIVYAVLNANPTFNGTNLFHASRGNLAGTAAAPTTASFDAGRAAMAVMKDPSGQATLNIRPAYAIVPVALEGTARVVIESEFDPSKTQRVPNSVRGLAQVVADARLDAASTTAWYFAASPMMVDTIEVAFLDGQTEPQLEEREGWSVDGVEMKVRHEFGVAPLDYVGLYKNAGA